MAVGAITPAPAEKTRLKSQQKSPVYDEDNKSSVI